MKTTAFILTMLVPAVVSAQQKPTTSFAPVNGLKTYYEFHGSGESVMLLRGAFMTIANNWNGCIRHTRMSEVEHGWENPATVFVLPSASRGLAKETSKSLTACQPRPLSL